MFFKIFHCIFDNLCYTDKGAKALPEDRASQIQKSVDFRKVFSYNSRSRGSLFLTPILRTAVLAVTGRVIEVVITSCTRNAVVLYWARGFESHTLRQNATSTSGFAVCGLFRFYFFFGKYTFMMFLSCPISRRFIVRSLDNFSHTQSKEYILYRFFVFGNYL